MKRLPYNELLKLKRWNTPTIYNGWEQITKHDRTKGYFNLEETRDYMPQMGPMIGYAVTVTCEPGNPTHKERKDALSKYREYVSSIPFPKIVIVQDLDKPNHVGSFWGEVNANVHRALGCVGTITDGAIRDQDEMTNAGFKAIASRLCVGHAYSTPVEWGEKVEVFGCEVSHGSLIHADKHGFLVIPEEDMEGLYEAACFMDANECNTLIEAARSSTGQSTEELLKNLDAASKRSQEAIRAKFSKEGEW